MSWTRFGMILAGISFLAIQRGSFTGTAEGRRTAAHQPASDSPNVIIYMVDTLRADHLGCYGYPVPTSPNIDAFAEDATLFERTVAQSSWTRPSVASIMTGRYPREHGVEERSHGLKRSLPAIAPILHAAGYATAAFVTSAVVTERFGFDNGFDLFRHSVKEAIEPRMPTSRWATTRAIEWLDRRGDTRPFFIYVHTLDPHMPYSPPAVFKEKLAPAAGSEAGSLEHVVGLRDGKLQPGPRDLSDITALYDAEIAANDAAFGGLLSELRRRGLYDSTLIIFISDHGEELLDHDGWEHGATLYEEMLHVPVIIRFPRGRAAGSHCRAIARHVDVLPTVLESAGIKIPSGISGRSLYAALHESQNTAPPSFAALSIDRRRIGCVIGGDWKLTRVSRHDHLPPGLALYDLANDPKESLNRSLTQRVIVESLLRALDHHESGRRSEAAHRVPADPSSERELRELGYF